MLTFAILICTSVKIASQDAPFPLKTLDTVELSLPESMQTLAKNCDQKGATIYCARDHPGERLTASWQLRL